MSRRNKRKPQQRQPKHTVVIGYVHPEKVSSYWHSSLINLLRKEYHRVPTVISFISGPKVDSARNNVMKEWLTKTTASHLLMVDTDMILPLETIDVLLKADKDIIGGLCFIGNGPYLEKVMPTIRVIRSDDDGKVTIDCLFDYPINTLVKCDATGAACILIKRKVAEDIWEARGKDHPLPWFAHGVHNGVEIGEDVAFCLTAGKLGYEVWVDTGLMIPHVKNRFLTEGEYFLSLSKETHPYYDKRDQVPVYREILDASSS